MITRSASIVVIILVGCGHAMYGLVLARSLADETTLKDEKATTLAPELTITTPAATTTTTTISESNRKQSAPYAIDDGSSKAFKSSTLGSLVFRLSLNESLQNPQQQPGEPWMLKSENGTILTQANGLDLAKMLETLSGNNFTSEIHYDYPNLVNITILQASNSDSGSSQLASLDELIAESRSLSSSNGTSLLSVVKDNHRFLSKHPARSKPSVELPVMSFSRGGGDNGMTAPPIRRTMDFAAENYTARKIAEEANNFALKLLNQLNIEQLGSQNIIQSPFSIYHSLALLLSGAQGDTARELDRLLLGSQSIYEDTKLTHDQDRARLMSSLGEVLSQLYRSATNHWQSSLCRQTSSSQPTVADCEPDLSRSFDSIQYNGGTEEQHLIIANNLLFSPNAHEISMEFKNTLLAYYNNTALTKIETGSTESVHVINGWIRRATSGLIPFLLRKSQTFDEFHKMTLLSTSWLSQEWREPFTRVSSPVRTGVRLKGQMTPVKQRGHEMQDAESVTSDNSNEPLLEFFDDLKGSHFVEYIKSKPTRNIHHYNLIMNGQWVDVVVVQFRDSNQRFVSLSPIEQPVSRTSAGGALGSPLVITQMTNMTLSSAQSDTWNLSTPRTPAPGELSDTSPLTKLIASMASNPKRTLRVLWNTIAPEIITKHTNQQNMQIAIGQQMTNLSSAFSVPPLVRLSMPLLRAHADVSLSAALNHVGLVNAFDPAQANFIGINGHPFNCHELHLSNVIYKTTLNLNELGLNYDRTVKTLESLRILPTSTRKKQPLRGNLESKDRQDDLSNELVDEIRLNKPFVYFVCDVKTRLILYTGVVRNPAEEQQ